MNIPKKVEEYYSVLEQFREHCSSNVKKVIDIFTPLLYKNNCMPLIISIGSKDGNCFIKYLSAKFNDYSMKLDCSFNSVCINIYNNQDDRKIAFVLDFTQMENVSVSTTYSDNITTYRLSFEYHNGLHYVIKLMCK